MTLSNTTNTVTYACDDSDTTFDFTFPLTDDDDLQVILITIATGAQTVLTKTTDYSLASADVNDPQSWASGGTVTTVSTYSSAYKIQLRRKTARTQSVNIDDEEVEEALDKLTMICQDLGGQLPSISAHDYRAGTTAWTLTETEARATHFVLTNAGGAVNMIFPAVQPGKQYTVYNATGQTLTVKVTGQTGHTVATGKYALGVMHATDCVEIYEQP